MESFFDLLIRNGLIILMMKIERKKRSFFTGLLDAR